MRGGSGLGSGARLCVRGWEELLTASGGRGQFGIGLFGAGGTKFGKERVSGAGPGFFNAKSAEETRLGGGEIVRAGEEEVCFFA